MQKKVFLVLAACLMLVVPVAAVTLVPRAQSTITIQPFVNIECSHDSFAPSPTNAILWVIFMNTDSYPDVFVDGKGPMPMWSEKHDGYPGFQYGTTPGVHDITLFKQGYKNSTGKIQTCLGKVTYFTYDQSAIASTTATTAIPTTTVAVQQVTTIAAPESTTPASLSATQAGTVAAQQGTSVPGDTTGTLSVTTTPAGAYLFIDGTQRGISPATVPALPAGEHTLLLRMAGYEDLTAPVTITAGKTQQYSTGLVPKTAAAFESPAPSNPTTAGAKSPGFEFILAFAALGTFAILKKNK